MKNKNGLLVLNIGFLIILLSASGEGMVIDYFILVAGLFIAGIGAWMVFGRKNRVEKK